MPSQKRNDCMRHHNQKRRFLIYALVLTVCFSLVAAMTMAYAAEKTMKGAEQGQGQAQQMCPPASTPGTATCTVNIDCPAIKSSGKTVCQATIDCPATKPAQPEKGKKTK
jgi:hypothetical protein